MPLLKIKNLELTLSLQRFFWHLLSTNQGRYVPLYFIICVKVIEKFRKNLCSIFKPSILQINQNILEKN